MTFEPLTLVVIVSDVVRFASTEPGEPDEVDEYQA